MFDASAQELLKGIERRQERLAARLAGPHRSQLGQFFTPASTAGLIASMLAPPDTSSIRLLDPGAGFGILAAAAVIQLASRPRRAKTIELVAYEIDSGLVEHLRHTLIECERWARSTGTRLSWELRTTDYLTDAAASGNTQRYDAIIMNPPYRKVRSDSRERAALEAIGLRVVNLYTAFLAVAATQLDQGATLAAITPRSFANGPYHEPFRRFFFDRVGIERLHVFESRSEVFANADVLQENIVLAGRHGHIPTSAMLSVDYGPDYGRPRLREVPHAEIIHPGDDRQFLRIPTAEGDSDIARTMASLPATAAELGVSVSTGPVVDFRAKKHLRQNPSSGTVPLIYPGHLDGYAVAWPNARSSRKPNALRRSQATSKLLLPNETYVLVKRFTAKEERRRVVAAVMGPADVPGDAVAIENHLNVFHNNRRGLDPDLAHGLAAYLNSSFVDRYVRQFSGHTQINATDLRHLRYPRHDQLRRLGASMRDERPSDQDGVDRMVAPMLGEVDRRSRRGRSLAAAGLAA